MIRRFLVEEEGQTATELMLLIAVVSVALLSAVYVFSPEFREGIDGWGDMFETAFGDGDPPRS